MRSLLIGAVLALSPLPAVAQEEAATAPAYPAVLPLKDQAALRDAWLKDRLDTIVPALMREAGIYMWVLVAREYMEDPVVATMLDARSLRARRRTILVFFDPGGGKPVERLTVSRYGLADLFAPAWDPEKQPDQWQRLGQIIAERDPKTIAINVSPLSALADGLTKSQYDGLTAALSPALRQRIVSGEKLAVGWLETRTPGEMKRYPEIVRLAHAIIGEAFSNRVITPGETTADDVRWWMREKVAELKLATWFHPSVSIFRQGTLNELSGDSLIRPGDLLWTDFGITYLGLNTDTQHLAYVLKPGERDAPAGLKAGMAAANAAQDATTSSFATGRDGNAILADALRKTAAAKVDATIYSHPLGFHGHAAGSAIGMWDGQKASERGEHPIRPNTAWSIELNAVHAVPEWGGQKIPFRLEEDAFFDGKAVRYIDGRQTRFHLIR